MMTAFTKIMAETKATVVILICSSPRVSQVFKVNFSQFSFPPEKQIYFCLTDSAEAKCDRKDIHRVGLGKFQFAR